MAGERKLQYDVNEEIESCLNWTSKSLKNTRTGHQALKSKSESIQGCLRPLQSSENTLLRSMEQRNISESSLFWVEIHAENLLHQSSEEYHDWINAPNPQEIERVSGWQSGGNNTRSAICRIKIKNLKSRLIVFASFHEEDPDTIHLEFCELWNERSGHDYDSTLGAHGYPKHEDFDYEFTNWVGKWDGVQYYED